MKDKKSSKKIKWVCVQWGQTLARKINDEIYMILWKAHRFAHERMETKDSTFQSEHAVHEISKRRRWKKVHKMCYRKAVKRCRHKGVGLRHWWCRASAPPKSAQSSTNCAHNVDIIGRVCSFSHQWPVSCKDANAWVIMKPRPVKCTEVMGGCKWICNVSHCTRGFGEPLRIEDFRESGALFAALYWLPCTNSMHVQINSMGVRQWWRFRCHCFDSSQNIDFTAGHSYSYVNETPFLLNGLSNVRLVIFLHSVACSDYLYVANAAP